MEELQSKNDLCCVECSSFLVKSFALKNTMCGLFYQTKNCTYTSTMWWKRSPPWTNSMTKKSLSLVWKEAKRAVRNRQLSPRARISLSRKVIEALSWLRTSFFLTVLIAHSLLSEILSAKITCFDKAWYVIFIPSLPSRSLPFPELSSGWSGWGLLCQPSLVLTTLILFVLFFSEFLPSPSPGPSYRHCRWNSRPRMNFNCHLSGWPLSPQHNRSEHL